MAYLGPGGFDATKHRPMSVNEPLPAGRYLAAIVPSDMRQTKRGDGEYLWLRFRILEGVHRGRHLHARLMRRHPSPAAVARADSELTSICQATGIEKMDDSADLHDIPLVIFVVQRTRADTGDLTNEIRGYFPRESRVAEAAAGNTEEDRATWKR